MLCKFCKEDQADVCCDVCDNCWYGMRLEPAAWKKRLEVKGIQVEAQNPHVAAEIEIKGKKIAGVGSRDPYKVVEADVHQKQT